MADQSHSKQNGCGNDTGGGGGNVSFSGFTYTDSDSKRRADIELINDKGKQIKKYAKQAPTGKKTPVNGVTGVNKIKVSIKKKDKEVFSDDIQGKPTGSANTLHYYSDAKIVVEGNLDLTGTEVEDDK